MTKLLALPVLLLTLGAQARSRSVWHGNGFHLLDSQLARFLTEAYEGRVIEVKVGVISRELKRQSRRRVQFQIERSGKIYTATCDLVAKPETDELSTHACKATPTAAISNFKRPLSAFTYVGR